MAEFLDRGIQRALLERLHACYPATEYSHDMTDIAPLNVVSVNTAYLAEHKLVTAELRMAGRQAVLAKAAITAKGIDFLADDGGLSAILGVTVVKLHSDTIRDLLIDRVRGSDEPDTVKDQVIAQLKATPAQALGQLTERALDAGLRNLPQLGQLLQGWMG